MLGPEVLAQLQGGGGLESFIPQNALNTLNQASQISPGAENALQQTAQGDFLFGGQGFDQAVQAAQRAATPGVISGFGGRSGGGLGRHAVEQSAVDAFARQFAGERGNQLGASQFLSQRGTGAANALGQFGNAQANRDLAGNQVLAGLSDSERNRALQAAGGLPGIGQAGAGALLGIGNQQQQQNQFGIDRPMQIQQMILQAAMGGLPIEALLGQDVTGKGKQSQFGFGFGRE